MEPFEFNVDTSTIYIKILNGLGFVVLGFAIGILLSNYKHGESIDWLKTITMFSSSLFFIFVPYNLDRNRIIINENGISVKEFSFRDEKDHNIKWDKISSIRVERNQLSIKKTIGSYERVRFPIFTKNQVENLKTYLKEVTPQKEVEYLG